MDSACNPYLAYAAILAAGLRGIEEGYELDEPARDDVFALTRRARRAMGYRDLPNSLDQALRHLERSEFMAEVLGEQVFESLGVIRERSTRVDELIRQISGAFEKRPFRAATAGAPGRPASPVSLPAPRSSCPGIRACARPSGRPRTP